MNNDNKFTKGKDNYYSKFDLSTVEAIESELIYLKASLEQKLKDINSAKVRKQYPTEELFIKEVKNILAAKDATHAAIFAGKWCDCNFQTASEIVSQIITESLNKESFDKELRLLISSGRKIDAIKKYRETYGVGLAESKLNIEKIQEDMAKEFRKETEKRGEKIKTMSDTDLLEHLSNIGSDRAKRLKNSRD